jgi:hypothetical protein
MPGGLLLYVILLIALILAMIITHFLARRIEKTFSKRYSAWVYLLISIFPLKELIGLWRNGELEGGSPYLWFWIAFWLSCLAFFWRTRLQWIHAKDKVPAKDRQLE